MPKSFLDKFEQLVRILLDRRSWRSRQISTLVWLSPHHMRHSSTTPRLQYVLFPNIYISGPRCHQPLHPASRWPGLPSTQSIPAPHWGAWHHGTMPPKKVCTLPQHISRQLVPPRSSSPSPPLTWCLTQGKMWQSTENSKIEYLFKKEICES